MAPQDTTATGGDRPPQMTEMRRLLGAMQRQVETIVRERELTREIQADMSRQLEASSKKNGWVTLLFQIGLVAAIGVMMVLAGMLAYQSSGGSGGDVEALSAEVKAAESATSTIMNGQNQIRSEIGTIRRDIQTLDRSYQQLRGIVQQMDVAIGDIRSEITTMRNDGSAGPEETGQADASGNQQTAQADPAPQPPANPPAKKPTPPAGSNQAGDNRSGGAASSAPQRTAAGRSTSAGRLSTEREAAALRAAQEAARRALAEAEPPPVRRDPVPLDPLAFGAPALNDPRFSSNAGPSPTIDLPAMGPGSGRSGGSGQASIEASGGTMSRLGDLSERDYASSFGGEPIGGGIISGTSPSGSTGTRTPTPPPATVEPSMLQPISPPPLDPPAQTSGTNTQASRAVPTARRNDSGSGGTASGSGFIYTSRQGETLAEIAAVTGVAVPRIMAANPDYGLRPDMQCHTDAALRIEQCPLKAGTKFVIPR